MTESPVRASLGELQTAFRRAGLPPSAADCWPSAPVSRQTIARPLPVRGQLEQINGLTPPSLAALVQGVIAAEDQFQWGQTYTEPRVSAQFLKTYGWAEFAGRKGPVASDAVAIGVLLLGPNTLYPAHNHPAEEYYLPLAGVADWYREGEGWRTRAPEELIHHTPYVAHGVRTRSQPILAAYLWLGQLDHPAMLM